ncbi:MAG: hypothetical protein V5B44_05645 [Candidatus Accumulibacter necessarius]|uniref:hypothetical protein n=1 Tax=Candidatus Accumulibacter necessarius TaxID=2954386 RepID=UPI002FC398CD
MLDHAFLAAGRIDLYEATFDPRHLREALALTEATERLLADPAGGWYMSSDEQEALIARARPAYDGAEPSGTSVALMNALRLGLFTGEDCWRQAAERGLLAHAAVLRQRLAAMTEALLPLDLLAATPLEIAVVWPDGTADATAPLLSVLRRKFLPARALRRPGIGSRIAREFDPLPSRKGGASGSPDCLCLCHHGSYPDSSIEILVTVTKSASVEYGTAFQQAGVRDEKWRSRGRFS